MAPLMSIIIPVYNIKDYLERCIRSLTAPCGQEYEIILVDDGSTDGSETLCDALAADPRIRVIHKENAGAGIARNAGIAAARGDYLLFVDGDDYLTPGALDTIGAALLAHRPDMLRHGYQRVCGTRVTGTFFSPYEAGLHQGEALEEIRLDAVNNRHTLDYEKTRILAVWAAAFRRDWILEKQITFSSERVVFSEDYLFCLQATWAAASFYVLHEPLYCYYTRPGSQSMVYRERMMERKRNLFEAYCRSVPREDPEIARRLDNFYIDCVYDAMTNEANSSKPAGAAIAAIGQLLSDPRLQEALERNRSLAATRKTKIICRLMGRRMAAAMYWGYRWVKKIQA